MLTCLPDVQLIYPAHDRAERTAAGLRHLGSAQLTDGNEDLADKLQMPL